MSADQEDFQSFPLDLPDAYVVQEIEVTMKGTTGGGCSFYLLDATIIGTAVDNPTTTYTVGIRTGWFAAGKGRGGGKRRKTQGYFAFVLCLFPLIARWDRPLSYCLYIRLQRAIRWPASESRFPL